MFIKENISLAIAGLKASKMRALLTMLGIIIGISSVIAIFSIGSSLTSNMASEIDKAGINNIQIRLAVKNEDGTQGGFSSKDPEDSDLISLEQINSFMEVFKDKISNVSIEEMQGGGKVKDGYLYANVTTTGVNDGYKDVKNVKMISGRFINDKDIKGMKKSAIVSDKLVNSIFKGKANPLGKEIKVYTQDTIETYVIVGVYKYEASTIMDEGEGDGGSMVSEKDKATNLYVPMTTVKASQKYKNYNSFSIIPNRNVDSKKLVEDIKKYIDKLYKNNKYWTLKVVNMQSMMEGFTSQMATMSMGVSAIAAIALLVGGIGVMNIMLVSVTERTREIGTRKALGAKNSHIRMQFITESVIICSIGGVIGIILGIGISAIACHYLESPMLISIPTIIISFTFSMAIGVFFGYYPAKKAASMDPIEALRYE